MYVVPYAHMVDTYVYYSFYIKKKQCPVESHPQEESILQRVFDPDTHTHPHTLYMTRYTFQFLKKIYICV